MKWFKKRTKKIRNARNQCNYVYYSKPKPKVITSIFEKENK